MRARAIAMVLLAARAAALAAPAKRAKLGPGSFEPAEWAVFPRRAALFDEVVEHYTVAFGSEHKLVEANKALAAHVRTCIADPRVRWESARHNQVYQAALFVVVCGILYCMYQLW